MRSESLRESQEGVQRLQAQVRILRETTQALSEEMSVATQRQLAEHSERLNAESAAALEEAVGVVRSQMEATLYAAVAAHERSRVELAGARAALAERDATLDEIRHELTERRNAMTKLHEACHRHDVVAAANKPVSLAIGAHPGAWIVEAVGSDGAHDGVGAGGVMSAHAWFILASYAIATLAIGGAALAIVLDYRALKRALDKLPASPDEEARK